MINGEKWYSSSARFAAFYIVMVKTDPDAADPYRQMSMFIVPADAEGIEIVGDYGYLGQKEPEHAHIRWNNVRVPAANMLGGRGDAFVVAQVRLGGGRLHHAMRALAEATKCLEYTCERVVSRKSRGQPLWRHQMVQERLADAWIQLRQFRLLVLETAWLADQSPDWKSVRQNVSAVKVMMPKVLHDISSMAMHLHGSLGLTTQMPFADHLMNSFMLGLADGPTEVHKTVVAREMLRDIEPAAGQFPDYLHEKVVARARAHCGLD